jgi:hypothetical protein
LRRTSEGAEKRENTQERRPDVGHFARSGATLATVIDLAAARQAKLKKRTSSRIERHFASLEREYFRLAAAHERRHSYEHHMRIRPRDSGTKKALHQEHCRAGTVAMSHGAG